MNETNNGVEQKNNTGKVVGIVFAVFGVVLLIVILGVIMGDFGGEFKVSGERLNVEYNEYLGYSATITGTIVNEKGRNYDYIQVEYTIYDINGNNLGTALDNINNLADGDTWQFEANLFDFADSRPASFKLVDITGW